MFRQGFASSSDNQVTKYFKDWNKFLSPRADGYGSVDEPKIDIGVHIVAKFKDKYIQYKTRNYFPIIN